MTRIFFAALAAILFFTAGFVECRIEMRDQQSATLPCNTIDNGEAAANSQPDWHQVIWCSNHGKRWLARTDGICYAVDEPK